jgi:hypothetical protein
VTELEDLADKRDDNNTPNDLAGKMLHSFDGTVMFNRMPLVYIPQLDGVTVTDSTTASFSPDPIYCVDWTKLQPTVRDGYWMEEKADGGSRSAHHLHRLPRRLAQQPVRQPSHRRLRAPQGDSVIVA